MNHKYITPKNILNKVTNSVFDIGNTGRIVHHEVLESSQFDKLYLFKTKHRGVVIFKDNSTMSMCGNFFSDPRAVVKKNTIILEEMKRCEDIIESYSKRIDEYKERLKYEDEHDKEVIDNFLINIKYY